MNRKKQNQRIAFFLFRLLGGSVLLILVAILGFIVYHGLGVISWEFLSTSPQEGMTEGGIFPAIFGTVCLIIGSMLFAIPLGVMSAIYICEYARQGRFVRFVRVMTNNLAGVPSVVFGLFGMTFFVNTLGMGDSILAGSLTLALVVLPLVIRTSEEALKAVPDSYRYASYALGAGKLTTIRRVILPVAGSDIMTGIVLSMSRVSGETAPILFTVAAYFLPQLPSSVFDQVMALPYHLYVLATSGTDMESSSPMAYGTALVLIVIVLFFNLLATFLRSLLSKNKHS